MNLLALSKPFRRSLFAYLRSVMSRWPRQPEIDRLAADLRARRKHHRSTKATLARLRAVRIEQLKREVSHV